MPPPFVPDETPVAPKAVDQAAPERGPRETPLRRQYEGLKAQHPGCLLLVQLGDFFESFEEDARTLARVCGVTLTAKDFGKGDRVPLAGVPITRLDTYLARLVEVGLHVAVAEQTTPPGSGLVERVITRVVTPGTVAEPGLLREKENSYLAAIKRGRDGYGLAYVDVTTGEFAATQVEGAGAEEALRAELERLLPAEVLVAEGEELALTLTAAVTPCPAWRFKERTARERLTSHFRVASLEGFGCQEWLLATGAAGAILAYLEETNRRLLGSVAELRSYAAARAGMVLDSATRRNLELVRSQRGGRVEGSLLAVLDRTCTPMGGRRLRRWLAQPLLDVAVINHRLDAVERFVRADQLRAGIRAALAGMGDLERLLARVSQGTAGPRDLLDLAGSLRAAVRLRDHLLQTGAGAPVVRPDSGEQASASAHPRDELRPAVGVADAVEAGVEAKLDACPDVADLVERAIAPPGSGRSIRPGFCPALDELVGSIGQTRRWLTELEQAERLRTGIKSLKVGHNRVFGYYLEVTRPNLGLVPASYQRKQTLVSAERFVTPELKRCEARIQQAEERILLLEREAFEGVVHAVAAQGGRVRALADAVAEVDVYAALAEVAHERGYCRPVVDAGDEIRILEGRHPVVEARQEAGQFIGNDTALDGADHRTVLLTGPNMAGKSTYLRQVALIVLLAQVGSFVPAEEARIGVVDRIFTRVGAEDDIASGASTFMVEMAEAAHIVRHATARSLVILDEIGRGTSTFDGLAIARAVVEHIHTKVGARTLFATHFHELAALGEELPGVQVYNAAVADEGGQVVFLRKIVPGAADRSYGIHVARLAGLPEEVTGRAEVVLRELEANSQRARAVNWHRAGAADGPEVGQRSGPGQTGSGGGGNGVMGASQPAPRAVAEGVGTYVVLSATPGDENGDVAHPARALADPHLSATPGEASPGVLEEILHLDIANLTPLAALNTLAEIQRRLRAGRTPSR